MSKRFLLSVVLLLSLGLPLAAQDQTEPIRVGSKLFTEDVLLGHITYVALEQAGYPVVDMLETGNTTVARTALLNNQIDLYPEYTGTAMTVFFPAEAVGQIDSLDSESVYAVSASYDAAFNDLIWLEPAPINNSYVLAVTQAFAEEHGLSTLSDFAAYVNGGGTVMFAAGEEFVSRPDGLQAMEAAYGFDVTGGQMLVIADGTPDMFIGALAQGINGINVALATGVSGLLYENDLVALYDDQELLLPYEPAVVVRGALLRRNPEIAVILNRIFRHMDADTLSELVAQVEADGRDPREVATEYLASVAAAEQEE
ncbi:MAG: ABC transporter substrate-binding protein [Anaerolineae bacterium]|jgi:osmoprotectant transport system substrate-binding protein|nr:ABC transporter substrate-binding protein [Anaerolineae bacterium]